MLLIECCQKRACCPDARRGAGMRKLRKLYPESDIFFRSDPENPTIVYLIHFHKKYCHAKHYVGSVKTSRYTWRMQEHESGGNGSKLLKAVRSHGISWHVSQVWEASRKFETWLKQRKHASRHCPVCNMQMQYEDRRVPKHAPF